MKYREATAAEILADQRYWIEKKRPVRFRHFVRELNNPRAANGVSHREHSHSAIRVIDGVPMVRHHGKLEPVTATVVTTSSGKEIVFDLRIKSPYLSR